MRIKNPSIYLLISWLIFNSHLVFAQGLPQPQVNGTYESLQSGPTPLPFVTIHDHTGVAAPNLNTAPPAPMPTPEAPAQGASPAMPNAPQMPEPSSFVLRYST